VCVYVHKKYIHMCVYTWTTIGEVKESRDCI